MGGATYEALKRDVAHIILFLKKFFEVEILVICGNNELMQNMPAAIL